MAKLNKLDTKIVAQGVALGAQGASYRDISKQLGVSPATAGQFVERHREAINELALTIIAQSIQPIKQAHLDVYKWAQQIINIGLKQLDPDKETIVLEQLAKLGMKPDAVLQLADKQTYRMLQIMGITPAHTPSTVVNMLFAGDKAQEDVSELESVQAWLTWKREADVEEAQIIEEEAQEDMDSV